MNGRGTFFRSLQKNSFCFRRKFASKKVAKIVPKNTPKKQLATKKEAEDESSFSRLQEDRRKQAERSVLIACPPNITEMKFLKHLSTHGSIENCFFYESFGIYAVVEFSQTHSIDSMLGATIFPSVQNETAVPFKTRLLSLKASDSVLPKTRPSVPCQKLNPIGTKELILKLSQQDTVDKQLYYLLEQHQLTEENIRLRFLVCSLLKDIAAPYFPECVIRLFGSSVNSFGKLGCDLDLFLDLDSVRGRNTKQTRNQLSLEFQMKSTSSERAATQSILSVIAECVDHFGPGCVGVQKILNARCPLVRFSHQPSGFQCDLTTNNRVALKSSEMLHLYGRMDRRVRAMVLSLRCWAQVHGLTNNFPGAWITNFSLTTMIIFFLQRRSPPLIPPLDQLRELAGPRDECIIEGNDCTFVSDISRVKNLDNTETLDHLLQEFFVFYANFPFNQMSINIRKGKEDYKPDSSPLYIQNPFELSQNVSKNVNPTQLERLVTLCQESAWLLNEGWAKQRASTEPSPWGMGALLLPSLSQSIRNKSKKGRVLQPASERFKNLLAFLKTNKAGGSGAAGNAENQKTASSTTSC
ncbi:poly(A) RNA polymerase, mitochondrial isoform X1 [Conger conger]|uniref:poly(A) RNA polymerase, mitochondrial isoform X1 n=1 Tax=Conger conger TaxID=82655 RepID=UPI002A5AD2F7|nr:poly(A) RNA polymerase, mitochondrial isoform X1 [Conger conger]